MRYVSVIGLALTLAGVGCGGSDWTASGTYEMVFVWGGGDCLLSRPRAITVTVFRNPETERLTVVGPPDAEVQGGPGGDSSSEECRLAFTIVEPNGSEIGFIGEALSVINIVERDGDIEGSGMLSVGPPDNCAQSFSVEGSKS